MTNSDFTTNAAHHLTEEQLFGVAFSVSPLSAIESAHLAACTLCQTQLAKVQLLSRELAVAKWSEPSTAAKERYAALFETARTNTATPLTAINSWLGALAETVKASVMWNGRDQLLAQGVRNASTASYRLLYSTEQAEIELLIEPVAGHFKVEGELLPMQQEGQILPVLLELYEGPLSAPAGSAIFSGESDDEGRFHIPPMPAGAYSLCLVPPQGAIIVVDPLELA